jgi:hypothetical protein
MAHWYDPQGQAQARQVTQQNNISLQQQQMQLNDQQRQQEALQSRFALYKDTYSSKQEEDSTPSIAEQLDNPTVNALSPKTPVAPGQAPLAPQPMNALAQAEQSAMDVSALRDKANEAKEEPQGPPTMPPPKDIYEARADAQIQELALKQATIAFTPYAPLIEAAIKSNSNEMKNQVVESMKRNLAFKSNHRLAELLYLFENTNITKEGGFEYQGVVTPTTIAAAAKRIKTPEDMALLQEQKGKKVPISISKDGVLAIGVLPKGQGVETWKIDPGFRTLDNKPVQTSNRGGFRDVNGNPLSSEDVKERSIESFGRRDPNKTIKKQSPGVFSQGGRIFTVDAQGNRTYISTDSSQEDQMRFKALSTTYTKQTANYYPLKSFVSNVDGQVTKLKDIVDKVARFDTRLLNIPIRKWASEVAGSPYEKEVSILLREIGTETAKIAGGATASIAEPSAEATKKWTELADGTLGGSDMIEVAEFIADLGKLRLEGVKKSLEETGEAIQERRPVSKPFDKRPPSPKQLSKRTRSTSGPKNVEHYIFEVRKANPSLKATDAELAADYKRKYGSR